MKHFLLFYDVCDNYVEKRASFRDAHLKHGLAACDRGELLLAGALADPVDGAVLLFQGDTSDVAVRFAEGDPYVLNGLIPRWRVREWTTVVGRGPSTPVRPGSD
ncbi:MAG: YciI-like protein [Bryobacteraceae bacterium]